MGGGGSDDLADTAGKGVVGVADDGFRFGEVVLGVPAEGGINTWIYGREYPGGLLGSQRKTHPAS